MLKNIIFFLVTYLIAVNCLANQPFKVVVGFSKPPYVIQESRSGFELELIEQILTSMGKTPSFVFIPYGRSEKMLALPDISAVMTANKKTFPENKNLSKSYIDYQNVAISLKENTILLNNIADMANYSVASFQKANKILGEEFALAVGNSPIYIQVAHQERQVELLLQGRVEILVMDIKIFLHFLNELGMGELRNDIQFHYVFPKTPYSMVFKKFDDVKTFNQALLDYKASEKYQKLLDKYSF